MLRLSNLVLRAWFVFALLAPHVVMAANECGALDRVVTAINMSEVLYPDIKGNELTIQFSRGIGGGLSGPSDARTLLISLDKLQSLQDTNESRQSGAMLQRAPRENESLELPMYLYFSFVDFSSVERKLGRDVACRPLEFLNRTETERMEDARAIINAHPDWTDVQELEAADKKGLRFGPEKEKELIKALPLKGLEAFYGPLRIKSTRFEPHTAGDKCAGCSFADLHWYIEAEEGAASRMLQITVEPFQGRITALSESKR